jgi:hypothetical protein
MLIADRRIAEPASGGTDGGGSADCHRCERNPNLDLPDGNPIYLITMPDRRPQFEQDWPDSVWAMVILLGILLLRYLT